MKMVHYQPRNLLELLNKEFFNSPYFPTDDKSLVETGDWVPSVDIKEEKDKFLVLVDIPGVDPKEVKISWENNELSVQGHREIVKKDESENYSRIERNSGTFYRKFSLPDTADSQNIKATSKHGVLEILIPKHEKSKPQQISIEVES